MNVLLIDIQSDLARMVCDSPFGFENPVFIEGEQNGSVPADLPQIDVIVAAGEFTRRPQMMDKLLAWRTHPYTYLTPCWIAMRYESFARLCLWPGLSIDRFDPGLEGGAFAEWLTAVSEWQQYRMQPGRSETLKVHGVLELISSLALRKATGRLLVFGDNGENGSFHFHNGLLSEASIRHLCGMEAFFELFSWSHGTYQWDPNSPVSSENTCQPLHYLITEGLNLIREANLLYHFVPDLRVHVSKTDSQSALDDKSAPLFEGQAALYSLLDGSFSVSEVVEASPMSRLRTMGCLAKWLSFGDVAVIRGSEPIPETMPETTPDVMPETVREPEWEPGPIPEQEPIPDQELEPPRRLVIVDDSKLMCHALQDIFSEDPRFEIAGVAHDGLEALDLIDREKPDVVTLDMQMPRMDGLTALKHIMIRNPRPVVILSAFTKEASELSYASFKYGAVDVYTKPSGSDTEGLKSAAGKIRDRVAEASRVRLEAARYIRRGRDSAAAGPKTAGPSVAAQKSPGCEERLAVILCGSGGFPALLRFLFSLGSSDSIPYVIVCMVMPPRVVESLAPHVERDCGARAVAAMPPGMDLSPATLSLHSYEYLGAVEREDQRVRLQLSKEADSSEHHFDRLLGSASRSFGERTAAFLLSGAGDDGIAGMRDVRENGGRTYVLSPHLCLKPDLPRSVLEAGYAEEVDSIAGLASLLKTFPTGFSGETRSHGIPDPANDLRENPPNVKP